MGGIGESARLGGAEKKEKFPSEVEELSWPSTARLGISPKGNWDLGQWQETTILQEFRLLLRLLAKQGQTWAGEASASLRSADSPIPGQALCPH